MPFEGHPLYLFYILFQRRDRLPNLRFQKISQNCKSLIIIHHSKRRVNLNLSTCLLLFPILGVYLGVEFQTHPIMNTKCNIIFALESQKKNGVPINALALGIPAPVVIKWTGHSDYKAMKPYIDIADDIRANAMNKFNQL